MTPCLGVGLVGKGRFAVTAFPDREPCVRPDGYTPEMQYDSIFTA